MLPLGSHPFLGWHTCVRMVFGCLLPRVGGKDLECHTGPRGQPEEDKADRKGKGRRRGKRDREVQGKHRKRGEPTQCLQLPGGQATHRRATSPAFDPSGRGAARETEERTKATPPNERRKFHLCETLHFGRPRIAACLCISTLSLSSLQRSFLSRERAGDVSCLRPLGSEDGRSHIANAVPPARCVRSLRR